ncbi:MULTISPECIES: hypothetical protein [unclassified Mesorhizobium]|uniref:DUF7689 domain-containing protein n=1 Tax=unclassified Mesorhizobium TaxID=325217 RepID=UPI000FC9D87D|nr:MULTISPECIES: hypothetical protein [unclassified Mesorhizobium]RVD54545.1 hypothetical protein EN783_30410 [Mesorhizobium sp. M2D.F.Ca.ET.140.01.1.1]TGP69398.1 hypothetical protein EN867_30990 [Mesorhizobium sp. M2D.F.Ca.ET.224.01.1.1]TGP86618.1 hypothetical protein EN865_30985 [bacterium M00.F.Ca.ET.222.01.1.1]
MLGFGGPNEMVSDSQIRAWFPNLNSEPYDVTSKPNINYNCFAWAGGVDSIRWDPFDPKAWWPPYLPRWFISRSAITAVYQHHGYQVCADGSYDPALEKVAVYFDPNDVPLHAARQIGENEWTSKLGPHDDLTHTLPGLEGTEYGYVGMYMSRPKAASTPLWGSIGLDNK